MFPKTTREGDNGQDSASSWLLISALAWRVPSCWDTEMFAKSGSVKIQADLLYCLSCSFFIIIIIINDNNNNSFYFIIFIFNFKINH